MTWRLTGVRERDNHRAYGTIKWCNPEAYSNSSQRRLHGRERWADLFTNQVRRFWAQTLCRLVSTCRIQGKKWISIGVALPRRKEDHQERAPFGLHGFSWDARTEHATNKAFRRRPIEQQAGKSAVGNAARKLAGSKSAWQKLRRGKTPCSKADRRSTGSSSLGCFQRLVQSSACCACSRLVPVHCFHNLPNQITHQINGRRGYRWEDNPTVKVIAFQVDQVKP